MNLDVDYILQAEKDPWSIIDKLVALGTPFTCLIVPEISDQQNEEWVVVYEFWHR